MMTRLICCGLLALSSLPVLNSEQTALAEDPPTRSLGKPLMRVWFPPTILQDHQKFLDDLRKELNDGPESRQESEPASEQTGSEPVRHEGLLVYFDPLGDASPIATRSHFPGNRWLNPVRFMAVANRDEFERIVRARTGIDQEVPSGVLTEKDGAFEFSRNQYLYQYYGETPMVSQYLEHISRYWRYRNGYMFFGDDELLLTMELPNSDDLNLRGRASERDLVAQIDLDAVASQKKNRFWNAMRKRLEKVLQQHDDEGQIEYAFRKSWGELQLHLLQALANDLQSIRLGIDFASSDQPAELQVDLIARPGADLEKYIGKTSVGTRQLAAAIEEPSILTVAAGWELPIQIKHLLQRSIALVNKELVTHTGFHADIFISADDLTTALQESLGGAREFVLKLSRSEQGFTLFGGIRLSEAQRVSRSLESLLNGLTSTTGTGVVRSRDKSGRLYLSYSPSHLSEFVAKSNRERFPAEAHLTVVDSTLWFSFGPPDSLDVLSRLLDRSEQPAQNAGRSRVPALLFEIALDRCLSNQESTKGFDRVPQLALQKLNEKLPGQQAGVSRSNDVWVDHISNGYELIDLSGDIQFGSTTPRPNPQDNPPERTENNLQEDRVFDVVDQQYNLAAGQWEELELSWIPYAPQRLDLNKFLKPDQSRIRAEFRTDSNRLRLKLTVGMGPIKHYFGQLLQSSEMQGVIQYWDFDNTDSNIRIRTTTPPLPEQP